MAEPTIFYGNIVHTKSFDDFIIITNGFLAFNEKGKIIGVDKDFDSWADNNRSFVATAKHVRLTRNQFLMPGFVDCHIHGPQFAQIGLGLDLPLLDWLTTYTFPLEAKFHDTEFAQRVYQKLVETTIANGTTLASYFGTNHKDSTLLLAKEALCQGQRALVGKVCSDCNTPDFYVETTEASLEATKEFVEDMLKLETDLVKPIITPRFALSCSRELLKGLGDIAREKSLHIQSHISESVAETCIVRRIFSSTYACAYESAGLLTKQTVLAHAVHLEERELDLLRMRGTSIAHCPSSNTMLNSGFCDVKRILNCGIKVGLGTDVSGGTSISIQNAILRALEVSKHLDFVKNQHIAGTGRMFHNDTGYQQLKYKQAIYMATLGGAEALALDKITGNFVEGKEFDALLIDVSINLPLFRPLKVEELIEKFIFTGDDRNILRVYVAGNCVKGKQNS